jgi:hypothetical protein
VPDDRRGGGCGATTPGLGADRGEVLAPRPVGTPEEPVLPPSSRSARRRRRSSAPTRPVASASFGASKLAGFREDAHDVRLVGASLAARRSGARGSRPPGSRPPGTRRAPAAAGPRREAPGPRAGPAARPGGGPRMHKPRAAPSASPRGASPGSKARLLEVRRRGVATASASSVCSSPLKDEVLKVGRQRPRPCPRAAGDAPGGGRRRLAAPHQDRGPLHPRPALRPRRAAARGPTRDVAIAAAAYPLPSVTV